MEQLPLTFVQANLEPEILECYTPAFNFTKLSSSNGMLAFTRDKLYWLPDEPIAMMDQGWWVLYSEIAECGKWGVAGFFIKLVDGKELRFSNVGAKMREGLTASIEEFKGMAPAAPAAPVAAAGAPDAEAPKADAPEPEAPKADPAAAEEITPDGSKVMGVLAYFGILLLIPLFMAKDSKFVRFHVNQGLILFICSIVVYVVGRIFPGLSTILWILDVAIFVLAIMGIVNVVKGRAKELPVIGKYRIIS